jgi:transcriptional regulator with XRE-family HTH domain
MKDPTEHLPQRLAQIRSQHSTRDFADILQERAGLSVTHSMIGRYEKGTSPPARYIAAVCTAFDVKPAWLLTGEGPRRWDRKEERTRNMIAAASWMREFSLALERAAMRGEGLNLQQAADLLPSLPSTGHAPESTEPYASPKDRTES